MRRTLALAALTALAMPAVPAFAQEKLGEAAEQAERYAMPLLVSPGMPNPTGGFTLRMNSVFLGIASPSSTGLTGETFVGLTPQLGVNLRTGFTQTGTSLFTGAWSDLRVEGQYAVMQTADKGTGLSLVAAGIIPGGVGGHNLGATTPGFGLRGQATMGPIQTHADSLYRPAAGAIDYGLAGVVRVTDQLTGSIDLLGSLPLAGGGTISLGIAPGVAFRLTPGVRIGVGYVVPVMGSPPQAGQLLAHMQLGI